MVCPSQGKKESAPNEIRNIGFQSLQPLAFRHGNLPHRQLLACDFLTTIHPTGNDSVEMKPKSLLAILGLSAALCAFGSYTFAADEGGTKATAREKLFIKKAAMGGMTEVALGKVAAQNGGSQDVKDFGNQMVTDHSKINDNLKDVAGKMGVTIPDSLDSMHQAMVDKMSKLTGAEFDKAYVRDMVKDHEKDVAEFERAKSTVKNDDLKKFIDDSVPTMKDHLDKIKKFDQAKGTATQ